jgi:hypothetical protein
MIILGVCGYGDRDIASSPLNRLLACRKQIRQVAISEIASADFVNLGMSKKGVIVNPLPGALTEFHQSSLACDAESIGEGDFFRRHSIAHLGTPRPRTSSAFRPAAGRYEKVAHSLNLIES